MYLKLLSIKFYVMANFEMDANIFLMILGIKKEGACTIVCTITQTKVLATETRTWDLNLTSHRGEGIAR